MQTSDAVPPLSQIARFKLFMGSACDFALIFFDHDRLVTEWTPGAEAIFGYRAEDAIGRSADMIFTEADRAAGVPDREAGVALQDGQANDERWHRRADGSLLFASGRLVALRDEAGMFHGFAKILRDVTAQRETDQQLRAVVERLNLATDSTGVGIWEYNFKTGVVTASDHACRAMGLGDGCEKSPREFFNLIAPEYQDEVRKSVATARDPARSRPVTIQFRVAGEDPRWLLVKAFPLRSEDGGEVERLIGTITDITPEKISEQSLRDGLDSMRKLQRDAEQNSQRYREIFETANEGIWTLDEDGRIELVNQRLAAMLGFSADEMIGRVNVEFGFPEDVLRWRERFAERRRGLPAWIDVRFRHKRGHEVWALMSARPLLRQGRFAGELDMFTDVTARRAAEQALRVSEEQFRTFFESAAAGHAAIDPRTRLFLRVNRRFGEITGYTPEELRGRTFTSITHPDDQASDDQRLELLLSGELHEFSIEKRFVHKSGRTVWVQVNSSLVRDADHQPLRQISVVQDITARKLGELDLQESRTQLALALEAAELGTFLHDNATGAEKWNARAKQLLGLPVDAPESFENLMSRVHPGDRAGVEAALENVFAAVDDRTFQQEFRVVWPDESVHHVAATGRVIWQGDGERSSSRILATMRDITATKRFEEELQAQVAMRTVQLEVKTAQLEGFCYTVAHDLRSPLRAISGYADFLLEDLTSTEPGLAAGYIAKIKAATKRLDALINDLLQYSRVAQSGVVLEDVPLGPVFATARMHLTEDIAARNAIIDVPEHLPTVRAERAMLEQVVINLLSNAVKFVPAGKVPHVVVSMEERGENVRVTVADNGIGVPPAYQRRIFGVFERLREAKDYPGTGVGLAIVQKAIERVGGTFGVESESGQGSQFWFELRKTAA